MAAPATHPVGTIAKLLMMTPRRVQQLTADGVIPRTERGRYEIAPAVQGYIKYLQDRAITGNGDIDYASEKSRLTRAQADLAEIEVARARGDVVGADQLTRNLTNLFAEIRTNLRNVPGRVSSSLLGLTDERKLKTLLLAEIDQALTALSELDLDIQASEDAEAAGNDGSA
nr:MAG TPA: DNA packaging protein [Caudoviricetes sp.]